MIDAGSVTSALPSAGQQDTRISNLTVGGAAVALGSLCVVVTSVLYALSPPAAALPTQPFDLASALAGAVAGGRTLSAAGTIGIFSDIVMAVGALLVGVDHARRGRALAAAGWSAILLSIVVFIFVDAIAGYVLVDVGAGRVLVRVDPRPDYRSAAAEPIALVGNDEKTTCQPIARRRFGAAAIMVAMAMFGTMAAAMHGLFG